MTDRREKPGALDGLKILDLAGSYGNYCGKLFADMGADTILIEPPEGAATRREPPFADGVAHPEASFRFAYENTSKRSVTLDLRQAGGRESFLNLCRDADLVIEGFGAGRMEALGLDGETLRAQNPALVLLRLSAFGQTGPFRDYAADDNTLMAIGGMMYLAGYPDAPPLASGGELAVNSGNLYAAVAGLIALTASEASGEGQDVDVSIQETVVLGLENAVQFYDLEGTVRRRYAGEQRQAGAGVFRCRDGMVYLLAGGVAQTQFWYNTVGWIEEAEGSEAVAPLKGDEWVDIHYLRTQPAKDIFRKVFEEFARSRTMAELYETAQKKRVPLCPVNTPRDVHSNRQLEHRGFFIDLPSAMPGRDLRMPGAAYQLSASPWCISRRPPRLGEHNNEILGAFPAEDLPRRVKGARA